KSVLELGAAGALPSLISACNGATKLVVTDYPDHDLIENIRKNVEANIPLRLADGSVQVTGFKWGYDIEKIADLSGSSEGTYDVLILCDLVFNHSEHTSLLNSVEKLMAKPKAGVSNGGEAYVFFTHHRPWLADKDMAFIERARDELGLEVTKVVEEYTGAMFDDDPGDERDIIKTDSINHKDEEIDYEYSDEDDYSEEYSDNGVEADDLLGYTEDWGENGSDFTKQYNKMRQQVMLSHQN
ncbi:Protein N-terminal and lysine N-methyltransferase efm7, partial [Coemansia sp. RSA 2607]